MNPHLLTIRRILRDLDLLGEGAYHHSRIVEDHCCETFYLVQFRYAVEDTYNLFIDWEDFTKLVTIGDLITYVELHLTNQVK